LFSRKYFSAFGSHEKITKIENANVAGIRQRPVAVAGIRRACLAESGQNCRIPAGHLRARSDPAGSGHIRPDSGHFGQIRPDQCPDPVISGRIPAILDRSGRISSRIRSYPAGFRPFWPDPAGSVSGSGQIRPDSGRFLSMTGFRPDSAGIRRSCRMSPDSGSRQYSGGRIPTPALLQVLDDAGFQCCLFLNDRLLLDSTSQISNVLVKTKNIILENDLRFLKP